MRSMKFHSGLFLFTPVLVATVAAGCNLQEPDYSERYINGGAGSTGPAPTPGPQPHFAQALTTAVAPPPISGGTLAVAPDGRTIVAADSDRDRIYVVDIPTRTVKFDITLAPGAEPGRVAIDSHGYAHVALRSAGALATIELATGKKVERAICTAPRGLAFDAKLDALHVACAEGSLQTLSLTSGKITTQGLDRDLRDVLVIKDKIYVSHFRSTNVTVIKRDAQDNRTITTDNPRGGNLGWRMVQAPPGTNGESDDVALVSQDPVNPAPSTTGVGYYGSGAINTCNSPTITTTRLDIPGEPAMNIPPAVLPVDLATNGREYAIVAAGNGHTPELPQLFIHHLKTNGDSPGSAPSSTTGFGSTNPDCDNMTKGFVPGQAIAAAFDGEDQLIVQSREPAALYIMGADRQRVYKEITLSTESREDTGHAIFHSNSGGFLACASCHAEGGEDGRTWEFVEGERRTPSMLGTLAHTAPFHWDGEMKDMRQLVDHVFTSRMSGPKVDDEHVTTLQTWLFRLPPPPKVTKPADAVARGSQIFEQRQCATCHSGENFTNNETVDVGTGARFQVPSLKGVGWRAPFLHNGCAKTLKDRFNGTACGGDKHGDVNGLTATDIADLSTFLDSL